QWNRGRVRSGNRGVVGFRPIEHGAILNDLKDGYERPRHPAWPRSGAGRRYWQASHSGSSMKQTLPSGTTLAGMAMGMTCTALSLPSVPFSVDLSTCVADVARR